MVSEFKLYHRSCRIFGQLHQNSILFSAIIDGGWSDFGSWSDCSAECGGGTQSRSRTCTNPAPGDGGADCEGDAVEERACNTDPCPGTI